MVRRTFGLLLVGLMAAVPAAFAAPSVAAPGPAFTTAVTVGLAGNEPLVRSAPDGTLYVSALQHLYVSLDRGSTWRASPGTIYSGQLNLASDSSIQVDDLGRLYFAFDYPYAGNTAVCTSLDKAQTFSCNPAVLPGGTDRMWLAVKDHTTSYIVTNEALYQTVFGTSNDSGTTFVPGQTAGTLADPTDGPLLVSPTSGKVVQPIIDNLTNQTATTNFESGPGLLRVYDPSAGAPVALVTHPIPLTAGGALPGAAYGKDGTLYVTSEKAVRVGSTISKVVVQVARSRDDGATWTVLPPVPLAGISTFVALGAGKAGHVGLVFFTTKTAGDPGVVPATTVWDATYAETTNALAGAPTWTVTTLEKDVHRGVICATAGCMGSGRFAGDFLATGFDSQERPLIVYQRDRPATQIRFVTRRAADTRPVSLPPVKKPVSPAVRTPNTEHGSLASTGLGALPYVALALLFAGWVARRRRTH
jgi:hypothetical protein